MTDRDLTQHPGGSTAAPQQLPDTQDGDTAGTLHRQLKSRHMTMIAIGGAIGTGLFLASGGTVSEAGPGGALLAYALIGFMVYLLMQSLGEMSTYLPLHDSFKAYGNRFVSPSFGFAQGWNYWFNWAITVAAELVAAALVMRYWFPDSPSWLWSALFLAILFLLNAVSVKAFGESEFWFSAVKVATVVVFLVVGVLMIFGVMGGDSPGFSNWTKGEAPFVGGPSAVLAIFMIAGFSFQGTEMVAVASGEAEHPERTIPKAIRAVFWRILLFYIGAIAVIGFLLPYDDKRLLSASENEDVTIAPFTLVFDRAGIALAAAVMNAVILTAILSAGNSGLYASTRMLHGLARDGQAPRFLQRVTRRGIPLAALAATTAVGALCFVTSLFGDGTAYTWLVNASGLAGFITWCGIAWSHFKFRRAYVAQGHDVADLPFRARWFPLGPLLALGICLVVILGQNYESWVSGTPTLHGLLSSYIGLPLFLGLWGGHKLITRAPKVAPLEADLRRH